MDEYFKKIKIGFEYASTQSMSAVGKGIDKAFESSNIGRVLAKGFNAHISKQSPLKAMFDQFIADFSEVIKSSIDRMDTLLKYSQMTDAQVRELKLGYGFSSSQAYGYSSAMEVMGFSSMEDLMYANEQQISQFRTAFEKYSDYYTKLADSGYFEKMQEYNVEMEMFRMDIEHELIDFFMNNKDKIMFAMDVIIGLGEFAINILSVLNDIADLFRVDSRRDVARSHEISSVSNRYSSSKNINTTIKNEFNNVNQNDTTWLAHAGQMTYGQILKVLTEGE